MKDFYKQALRANATAASSFGLMPGAGFLIEAEDILTQWEPEATPEHQNDSDFSGCTEAPHLRSKHRMIPHWLPPKKRVER